MKKSAGIILSILAVSACAKRPDAIAPVDIPMAAYSGMSCKDLATESVKENTNLAALSKSQNSAATADAIGVFLIGAPMGSVTGGDKEGQVAVSKGKLQAIENASKAKGC